VVRPHKSAGLEAQNKQWTEEAAAVVAAEGLPWQAKACWCEEKSGNRCAEFVHRSTGRARYVSVSGEHVATPALRRAELIRQLQR
jgi:hypothetical protein